MRTDNLKTWVELDGRALRGNMRVLKKLSARGKDSSGRGKKLMVMIKCNAYGHGFAEIARMAGADGADWFAVDNVQEGAEARRLGIKKPILVITPTPPALLGKLLQLNLSQVVYDTDTLRRMAAFNGKRKFKVHIKIDTGMSRQGIMPYEVPQYAEKLRAAKNKIIFEGLLTHFPDADNLKSRAYTDGQIKKLKEALKIFEEHGLNPKFVHSANTAGMFTGAGKDFCNLNRIGIGAYGVAPSAGFEKMFARAGIRPVLSWKARILAVKTIPKGAGIGYGVTEKAKRNLRVAVLPVGYYHGVPRAYSSVGHVLIGGRRCRVVGRVSMNLLVADISSLRRAPAMWDEAVLIGRQGKETITANEFAAKCGTIGYEIVTRINPVVQKVIV
ncbi:alanine racemase [Patescibacteria group bacterium]|nr:alanine racemase [Patescibacteria group bacterium]